ncbi:MAG: hypothetical protein KY475_11865 [Planctomycetes bacterium]|nr:hypothetical protein [Planctomycetota bacterium]
MLDDRDNLFARRNPVHALPRLLPGMMLLWRQYVAARDTGDDPWEFTVTGAALYEAGMTREDLRWLIEGRYVDYATLAYPPPANGLTGRSMNGYSAHAYVLTEQGAALMCQITALVEQVGATRLRLDAPDAAPAAKPHWDPVRRELRYRGVVVKHFRKPAPNQELILAAFQESGWPQRIDDPLPPAGEIVPAVRLHDTLGRLNRTLQAPIIHFGSDGTGQGVYWRPM